MQYSGIMKKLGGNLAGIGVVTFLYFVKAGSEVMVNFLANINLG